MPSNAPVRVHRNRSSSSGRGNFRVARARAVAHVAMHLTPQKYHSIPDLEHACAQPAHFHADPPINCERPPIRQPARANSIMAAAIGSLAGPSAPVSTSSRLPAHVNRILFVRCVLGRLLGCKATAQDCNCRDFETCAGIYRTKSLQMKCTISLASLGP